LFVFDFLRILYADIVNFTPLSEKFTPPELVQILNKLFGKFDQLAQVIFMVWKH
jgi:class 3 adenylate cyclase